MNRCFPFSNKLTVYINTSFKRKPITANACEYVTLRNAYSCKGAYTLRAERRGVAKRSGEVSTYKRSGAAQLINMKDFKCIPAAGRCKN